MLVESYLQEWPCPLSPSYSDPTSSTAHSSSRPLRCFPFIRSHSAAPESHCRQTGWSDTETIHKSCRQPHLVSIKLEKKNLNLKCQLQQPQLDADIPVQWGMDLSGGTALMDSTGTEGQEHLRCPTSPWLWQKTWSLSHSQNWFWFCGSFLFL